MEKSTETNRKTHRSEAVRLLEFVEAEASKLNPDVITKLQELPKELRLRLLLLAALEISGQNQALPDWGGLA